MIFGMTGWRGMVQVTLAVLIAGVPFAVTQFITANFLGPILVDVLAALVCLSALVLLLRVWQPATAWRFEDEPEEVSSSLSTSGPPPVRRAGSSQAPLQ